MEGDGEPVAVTLKEVLSVLEDATEEAASRRLNRRMRMALYESQLSVLYGVDEAAERERETEPSSDRRWVSEKELIDVVPRAHAMAIARVFARSPTVPAVVGVAEAAEILGQRKQYIYSLRDRGHMPEPVADLAGGPIYLREEIEALARKQAERKARREAKKMEKAA